MRLLAELARLLRLMDPMPPRVLADAEAAGMLLRPPVREADPLVSLLDTVPAVRCAGRRLRLGRPGGEPLLELEIRRLGPTLRLAGLAPYGARLDVDHPAGEERVAVNPAGYFTVEVPAGRIRLRLTEAGGRASATDWL